MTEKEIPPSPAEPQAPASPKAPAGRKKTIEIKTVLAIVVGLVIIGAALSMLNMNDISKRFIEKLASDTLKTPVTIGTLELAPKERRIAVRDIIVRNLGGFSEPLMLVAQTVDITIESGSPDQIIFKEIVVSGVGVAFEVQGDKVNLAEMQRNMDRLAASRTANPADKPAKPPVAVVIRSLRMGESRLAPVVNGAKMNPLTISPFAMTGIGEETGGILASQAMAQIVDQITRQAVAQAASAGLLSSLSDQALQDMKAGLGLDYLGQAREAIDELGRNLRGYMGRR